MQIKADKLWWIHKYEVYQQYGGPEEGGWWVDNGHPVKEWKPLIFTDEEEAFAKCRELHAEEYARRDTLSCKYTDSCSSREEWFQYDVEEFQIPRQQYYQGSGHYE